MEGWRGAGLVRERDGWRDGGMKGWLERVIQGWIERVMAGGLVSVRHINIIKDCTVGEEVKQALLLVDGPQVDQYITRHDDTKFVL